ncbi:TRAP transporter small permease [Oligella urethralis]|uniref:TRAP transporter small permease n=1 Tax=Oligella urethralis TaxID=90245 RepID=UPI0015E0C536|nr:TRAP transporter small permease [Oligella urethralis]
MLVQIFRWVGVLGKGAYYLSASLIVFIGGAVIYEVFYRLITGKSLTWVTEFSGYLLAGVIFLGLGYVYRKGGHVRMTLLLDVAKPRLSRTLYWITDFIVFCYAFIQLWRLSELAYESYVFNWRSSTTLEVALYLPQSIMVLGAFIFLLEIVNTAFSRELRMEN